MRVLRVAAFAALVLSTLMVPTPASAFDRLCDPAYENCRTPLIDLIRNETVGIDVGFWFMEDARYANELIAKHRAGVPVRVVFDQRAFTDYGYTAARYPAELMRDAGIPMRRDSSGDIFHFKMMLFAGQGQVEFSGANYSSSAFVPTDPYKDYVDEVIVFIDDPSIVNSFKTRFDDVWTATTGFTNYANVTTLQRHYPTYEIDPDLTFVPWSNFRTRSVSSYKAETRAIDAIMYRITDRAHTDTLIGALGRGVPVRLISEPQEYRNPKRLWHSWNVDRLYMAGAQVRHRKHLGINHEKLTVLHGQAMTIIGSSNWTSASATGQHEHNIFTKRSWMYTWARDHFNRKWNNSNPLNAAETEPFVPLPPDRPVLKVPADGATDQATSVTLTWYPGPWAHKYDVYVGTSPTNLALIVSDRELGPAETTSQVKQWTVSDLLPGTTYYWKVVGRTMANVSRASASVFSFTTGGTATEPSGALPSGWSHRDVGAVGAAGTASFASGVYTVQGAGSDVWGSADQFHYAYRTLSGDGSITARVDSLTNTNAWTKVGVMLRESTAANARHAFMLVSPAKGLAFQRRTATGGLSTSTAGPAATAPYWVRLTRAGTTITAAVSTNGSTWTTVGSDTFAMGTTILAGLAVSSHVNSTLATARFSGVAVGEGGSGSSGLPAGWSNDDVGAVAAAGSASVSGGVFTVEGSGADVWGTADELHYAYATMSGDGSITARVDAVSNTNAWTKAGVMLRETTAANARQAFMLVSPGKGLAFQRRTATGGTSTHTAGPAATAPYWVRLTRAGSTITAAVSTDGAAWTTVGSDTISMAGTILAGLGVSSHVDGTLASARFSNVSVAP